MMWHLAFIVYSSPENLTKNRDIYGGAASQHIGLPVCLFQLASGEVLLSMLMSNIVGEYRRAFNNYPGTKNEQGHTQTF